MLDRLRDDEWIVDGSGGWGVDSRSPKKRKIPENGGGNKTRGDLQNQCG